MENKLKCIYCGNDDETMIELLYTLQNKDKKYLCVSCSKVFIIKENKS